MPPKRRPKPDTPTPDADGTTPALKKQKSDAPTTTTATTTPPKVDVSPSAPSTATPVAIPDTRPICMYGASCYRKNPVHFKEFRHPHLEAKSSTTDMPSSPTSTGTTSSTTSSVSTKTVSIVSDTAATPSTSASENLRSYEKVLEVALKKNKITVDEKRMLRQFRRNFAISDADHLSLLRKFGWSEDEYDDGEKKDEDVELDIEPSKLLEGGLHIISLKKGSALKKDEEATFAKAATRFFATMARAQANFTVVEVGVIINAELKQRYDRKKRQLLDRGIQPNEEWGFHGTSRESILAIARSGFLHPDDLEALKKADGGKKKQKKKKKVSTVNIEPLDDGFYGRGIYFTMHSDYALYYSEQRDSDQVLLSKVITGKRYRCEGRMDGAGKMPGYDCHFSPKGNEIVIFDADQILPRYIITFQVKEEEEREQEFE